MTNRRFGDGIFTPLFAGRRAAVAQGFGSKPRRVRRGRAALPFALIISACLHVLILNLRFAAPRLPSKPGAVARNLAWVPVTRVYDILEIGTEVTARSVPTQRAQSLITTDAVTPDMVISFDAETPASAAERLATRPLHPILRERTRDPLPPARTALETARTRIETEIDPFNDSIAAAADASRRANDWTLKDANGSRWGVAPNQIHLGKLSLTPCRVLLDPFTCQFRIEAAVRDEYNNRLRTFNEIQQQAARVEARDIIDQRARAMRAAQDAKRDTVRAPVP